MLLQHGKLGGGEVFYLRVLRALGPWLDRWLRKKTA
jgi:hypothetical protein